MKRRIAVFTGTRAEYGLLYWLMRDIQASAHLELQIIASGTHLSPEFGQTLQQIEADGFKVDAAVEMLLSSNSAVGVAKSMGLGTIGYADALQRLAPDWVVILGDRFEALAMAQTALVMRVPIAHIHGGEVTEGAYDDAIRHAITKMANLHFAAAPLYRKRIIQMGESPERVFNVGALGLDHCTRTEALSLDALSSSLGFALRPPYVIVTYHPVTAGEEAPEPSFQALTQALDAFPDLQVLLTYPNADNGGRALIPLLEQYAQRHPQRVLAIPSLGFQRYISALRNAAAVVGNSSSGIIEAPAFSVPTVNIGVRQWGRLAASSVLHCAAERGAIEEALRTALSASFTAQCKTVVNPYGQGNASGQIVEVIEHFSASFNKRFYDLPFDERHHQI